MGAPRHGGHRLRRRRTALFRADGRLRLRLRSALGAQTMIEPVIGLAVGLCLAAYLLYTLIFPEKF
jgi:K+-transporting ATPase KdpF subunit